jgi:hypothetical protein
MGRYQRDPLLGIDWRTTRFSPRNRRSPDFMVGFRRGKDFADSPLFGPVTA